MKRKQGKLLKIRFYGDKILRQKAESIKEITPEVREFINDLVFTMYEKDGIGLAAPQVGKSWRIFVVDPFWYKEGHSKKPVVFINPEFVEFEGHEVKEEGCLSLPDIFEKVIRPESIKVKYLEPSGEMKVLEASEMFARAIQHEYDHLNGVLFIDKISKIRKIMIKNKLREIAKYTDENGMNIGQNEA